MRILKPLGNYKGFRIVNNDWIPVLEVACNDKRFIIEYNRCKEIKRISKRRNTQTVKKFGMKWKKVTVR